MAEGGNLSTIPLPGLIYRNDLSGEEFQQLPGTAQPGIQVPAPRQPRPGQDSEIYTCHRLG